MASFRRVEDGDGGVTVAHSLWFDMRVLAVMVTLPTRCLCVVRNYQKERDLMIPPISLLIALLLDLGLDRIRDCLFLHMATKGNDVIKIKS